MTQLEYQKELIAYDEKISLAELEASKATERVKELQYQKARFNLEWVTAVIKQQQNQPAGIVLPQ